MDICNATPSSQIIQRTNKHHAVWVRTAEIDDDAAVHNRKDEEHDKPAYACVHVCMYICQTYGTTIEMVCMYVQ